MIDFLQHIDLRRIIKHVLFWLCWIGGFTIIQSFGRGVQEYGVWLFYYLVTLPLFIVHTYAIAYWLVPHYFFRHRYLLFIIWVFFLFYLASVVELLLSNELIWTLVKPENIQHGNYLNWQNAIINGIGNEYIIIVFLSVKVVRYWTSKILEKTELNNQKLSVEIELLQYQSYPRFVLNIMDHLEKLAENNSPHTADMIIRLSNLMSNMTLVQKAKKILLYKEVELIRSYIDIQKKLQPNNVEVSMLVSGDLNGIEIPPFLFFQLVEEGFLMLEDITEKTDYTILLKSEPHYLLFSMTIWNEKGLNRPFNPDVLDNCNKYLNYFYPECHKVKSNFEVNFMELNFEIYL